MAAQRGNRHETTGARKRAPSASERTIATAGVLMFVSLLGYLAYQAIVARPQPPDVTVTVKSVQANGDNYIITFEARNSGGETASGVVVRGELRDGELAVETAEATLDYVPAGSTRTGGLFFEKDPGDYKLAIRALGYTHP